MKKNIEKILCGRKKKSIIDAALSPAAVILFFYHDKEKYFILFTERTNKVETHKGEISFPGGACRHKDVNRAATAMRECFEEIGVHERDVEILGELDDIVTITSNYVITPFVGTFPYPYNFVINEFEVHRIIEIPLAVLLDSNSAHESHWFYEGTSYPTFSYHYQGNIIWGATAAILKQFLDLVFNQSQKYD